jgi:hypothetical protein
MRDVAGPALAACSKRATLLVDVTVGQKFEYKNILTLIKVM